MTYCPLRGWLLTLGAWGKGAKTETIAMKFRMYLLAQERKLCQLMSLHREKFFGGLRHPNAGISQLREC